MNLKSVVAGVSAAAVLLAGAMITPTSAFAHCDTKDGPVVEAGHQALETGNINLVLIWVQEADEPEVRASFEKSLKVRQLGPEARELADTSFFETLVRVHRAGEGAPYTGLKSAGLDLGPAIPAADKAIAAGSGEALNALLTEAVHDGLHEQYSELMQKRSFAPNDVAAGRAYVGSYVQFMHWVERLFEAAGTHAPGHYAEAPAHAADAH